jgi:hypothetical protein
MLLFVAIFAIQGRFSVGALVLGLVALGLWFLRRRQAA